ncbi:MAG TPA: 3-oxoadipate enol-lactonase [Syntrophales bacterium]|nr:3-oxoadipate enol-lactonase [Syntrophales bacterium]HPQ45658.1 3-oxoadipate enol-lactonase [Syntrophales bacterium]
MPLISVNGTIINYRFDGPEQGPIVMLSTSLATNLTMWDSQVHALVDAGYRILRYDSRGHGRSETPAGPYSIDMLADDAVRLMDALDLGRIHFCGLSMGGVVGQMLGIWHSERLLSLTLCSTAAHMPPRELWDERIEGVGTRGMNAFVDGAIDRWFTKAGQERLEAEVSKIRDMILDTPTEGFRASCAALQDMDLRDLIRAIPTRTLVIVGEHDPGTPVSASQFIHEQIADSRLKIISDAAHLANVEQAGVFNETLLEFIETDGV